MESLKLPPTKAEACIATLLSLVTTSIFCLVTYYLWFVAAEAHPISLSIFTTLSLASIVFLYRAAFTTRRALSTREFTGVSWFFTIFGAAGVAASFLFTSDFGRGSMLASSLACLASGLAALRQKRNDA